MPAESTPSQPPRIMTAMTIPGSPSAALDMAPIDPSTAAYGIGSVGAALLMGAMWMRRKWPRDSNEILKDRTEGALLEKVMAERDMALKRADEAMSHRIADAGLIAGLQERNKYLQEECTRLNNVVTKMEIEFDALKKSIQNIQRESRKPIPVPGFQDENPTTY